MSVVLERLDDRPSAGGPAGRFRHSRLVPLALGSASVLAEALGLVPVALIGLVAVTALTVPAATVATAALVGMVVLGGATCVVLTVGAVAGTPLSGGTVLLILLIAAGAAATARPQRSRPAVDGDDVLATLSGLVTFIVFYLPFLGASSGRKLILLSFTTDAANHLQLVRAVMVHGGFVTLQHGLDGELMGGLQEYPPGFSGVTGTLLQALQGSHPTLAAFSQAAAVVAVGLYALLAWLGARLALALLRIVAPHAGHWSRAATAVVSTSVFLVGYNPQLLRDACYAQILATAAVLAAALVLCVGRSGLAGGVCLGFLGVTLMDSWYLLAPVLAAAVLIFVRRESSPRRGILIALTLAVPFWAFPVVTGPGQKHLSVPGFVFFPTVLGVLAIASTLAAAVTYLVLGPGPRPGRQLPLALIAATLSCTVLIGTYQALTDGTVGYYAVKLLYTTFVIAGCVTALVAGMLLSATRTGGTAVVPGLRFLAVVALALAVPAAALGDYWIRTFVMGMPVAADQARSLDLVQKEFPRGVPADQDVWVVDGCNKLRDFVVSKWAYDLSLGWSPRREELLQDLRKPKTDSFAVLITATTQNPGLRMTVYVHKPCHSDSLAVLAARAGVTVVHV